MTCLTERRLLEVHGGEGTAAERDHVASCAACVGRATSLARDLARIGTVLRSTPPSRRARRRSSAWRWVPVAAAAVLALAVVMRQPQPVTERGDDTLALADELVQTMTDDGSFDDDGASESTTGTSTCTWGDPLLGVGCDEPAVMQIAWR
jgi:hypothetical protein